jgi:hypothetical protein
MASSRAILTAVDVSGARDRERVLWTELALVAWLVEIFASQALFAVSGARLRMASSRAFLTAVDVSGAGDGERVLRAGLALVLLLVKVLSGKAHFARAFSRITVSSVGAGRALVGRPNAEGVLGT